MVDTLLIVGGLTIKKMTYQHKANNPFEKKRPVPLGDLWYFKAMPLVIVIALFILASEGTGITDALIAYYEG